MLCFKKTIKKCFCRCFEKISTNGGVTRAQYENMFAKYLGSQVCQSWFFILFLLPTYMTMLDINQTITITVSNVETQTNHPERMLDVVRLPNHLLLEVRPQLLHFVDFGKTLNLHQEVGPVTLDCSSIRSRCGHFY